MTAYACVRNLVLAGALAAGGAAADPLDLSLPSMGQPADQVMTPAEEKQLGAELMNQLHRRLDIIDDPVINDYVRGLGTRISSHSGSGQAFNFFVVGNPRVNAFAMPGGYIGINTGLITTAETESELASVIAHEIAHVTQRHLARQRLKGEQTSLRTAAMILASIVIATQSPNAGSAAIMGSAAASAQSRLNFSREHEREADRIGVQAMAAAGFEPMGMVRFFERLMEANRYRGEPPPFLSTHPLTRERIADARARAETLTVDEPFESPAFPYIHARARVLQADSASDAARRFRQEIEADGLTDARAYGLAVARIRADEPGKAAGTLERLLSEAGEYGFLYVTLAQAHLAAGSSQRALDVLQEGLSLYPGDYALRYHRIEALMQTSRGREAFRAASEAQRDFPGDLALLELRMRAADATGDAATAALATADYYAARGDLRGGLRQVERVLSMPTADAYQRSRAEALRTRWREALEQQRDS